MNTTNPSLPLLAGRSTALRRVVAVTSFLAVAILGILWMTGTPVQAGPYRAQAGARSGHDDAGRKEAGRRAPSSDEGAEEPLTVKGKVLRGKLNLNTATEEQLQMLPGIGESKARHIVEDRKKRGKYQRVRDLKRVKGIGYKTLKKLTPYLAVEGETSLQLE